MNYNDIKCDGCETTVGTGGYYLSTYKTERGTVPYVCKACHDEHYGPGTMLDDGCPACGKLTCSGRCT